MLMSAFRSGLLLLGLAALSACDSTEPTPEPPPEPSLDQLSGTWTVTSEVEDLYIVPAVDDEYPDFDAPGEGGIVVSGAVSDTLRYTRPFRAQPGGGLGLYSTYSTRPLLAGGEPEILLDYTSRRGIAARLTTTGADGATQTYSFSEWLPTTPQVPYPKDGRFVVRSHVLEAEDGRTVTIGGSLTVATRSVSAGDTVLLDVEPVIRPSRTTYAVEADGTVVRTVRCATGSVRSDGRVEGTATTGTFVFGDTPLNPDTGEFDCPGAPSQRDPYRLDGDVLTVTRAQECGYVAQLWGFTGWYGTEALPAHCEVRVRGLLEQVPPL